jgi:hypothetical protein
LIGIHREHEDMGDQGRHEEVLQKMKWAKKERPGEK